MGIASTRLNGAALPVLLLCLAHAPVVCAQSTWDGFGGLPGGVTGPVRTFAVQPDGRIVVGGDFLKLQVGTGPGILRSRIARLSDGGIQDSLHPDANATVRAVALQADGKILVAGDFTTLGGATRNHIGRLNPDGSLDTAFNPGANDSVFAVTVRPDGKIVVGGAFTALGGGIGVVNRSHIGILNADGTVDAGSDPGANSHVYALVAQPDGRVLVGGDFATLGGGGIGLTPRNHIGRVLADGTLDFAFDPGADLAVRAIALQRDGAIVFGGDFTKVGSGSSTSARRFLARVDARGTIDAAFDPHPDAVVRSLAVMRDGKIVVGGEFSTLGDLPRQNIGRLTSEGPIDATFIAAVGSTVVALADDGDGRTLVGSEAAPFLTRLYPDGSAEVALTHTTDCIVQGLALQPDRKILIGGCFTLVGNDGRTRVARLTPDGEVDPGFNPVINGERVGVIAVQPDGKILIGGFFTSVGDPALPRSNIARLNADGSLDPDFNPGTNGRIWGFALQPDGKILVCGDFSTIGGGGIGTAPRTGIGRLNPDGSLDASFDAGADASVYALAIRPDGKIVIGGLFTRLGGAGVNSNPRAHLARLNPDGSADAFDPGADDSVYALVLQADAKVVVGGPFNFLGNGTAATVHNHLGRVNEDGSVDEAFNPGVDDAVETLALQADGQILVGGDFALFEGSPRPFLVRLFPGGTLDQGFSVSPDDRVLALAVQADGKVVAGGAFTTMGDINPRGHLARLSNGSAAQGIDLDDTGTVVTWRRSGAAPELTRAIFESSSDGTAFTPLGDGTRIAGGWQVAGQSFPPNVTRFVRVRGYTSGGQDSGSSSFVESATAVYRLSCNYQIPPLNALAGANGGTLSADVTTAATACGWTATSNVNWITITGVAANTGSGTVTYRVAPNPVPNTPRTGSITIAGQLHIVNQSSVPLVRRAVSSDFDGDGGSDLMVWRPSNGVWYWLNSHTAYDYGTNGQRQWGSEAVGDVPLLGDIDGDGVSDMIVWRAATGTWFWLTSSTGYSYVTANSKQWGSQALGDRPLTGDIDGDGKADLIVWRASTGTWFWLTSSSGYSYAAAGAKQWGSEAEGDVPLVADIDGDGKSDLAVWRGSTGTWYWLTSSTGYSYAAANGKQWGSQALGDVPLLGDLDGDGRADLIVWRASTGTWYWLTSSTGYSYAAANGKQWGSQALGDVPLIGDIDRDGAGDLVVWRASTGVWFWLTSSTSYSYAAFGAKQWGSGAPAFRDRPMMR